MILVKVLAALKEAGSGDSLTHATQALQLDPVLLKPLLIKNKPVDFPALISNFESVQERHAEFRLSVLSEAF